MAVLTEAIEAERGAGAATAAGLVVTATVMTTARAVTSTVVVGVLALDLAPLMMTATIAPRVVRVGTTMIDATATGTAADGARVLKVVTSLRNLPRMNAIGVPFSYNSLQHV